MDIKHQLAHLIEDGHIDNLKIQMAALSGTGLEDICEELKTFGIEVDADALANIAPELL
jgi:chromatin segregation and condensation protein Rec8/ScpA/Scc1 (kleisin family)